MTLIVYPHHIPFCTDISMKSPCRGYIVPCRGLLEKLTEPGTNFPAIERMGVWEYGFFGSHQGPEKKTSWRSHHFSFDDGHLTRRFPHDLSTQLIRRLDVLDTAIFGISQFAMEGIGPFSSMINMIPSGNLLHSY
jgi:hypothetical protein